MTGNPFLARAVLLPWLAIAATILFPGCDDVNVKTSIGNSLPSDPTRNLDAESDLTILTWGEYFSPEVVAAFATETGIKVEFVEFTNLDEMQAMLQSRPADFDLVVVDGGTLADLIDLQLVRPIDRGRVPNFGNLDAKFVGLPFDPENTFSVPYMWGTTLLAYRSDKIEAPEASWTLLWDETLRGKVLMLDDEFDVYAAALLADGKDINSTDPSDIEAATQRMIDQVGKLDARFVDIFKVRDALIAGDCWASMTYSSDAAVLAEDCEEIAYFIPEEGAPLWLDSFVIPRESRNLDAAHRFLEFLCRPEVAAANSNELWCASANRAAKPFLSKEVLEDPTLYLSDEQLAKCQFDAQSSPERQRLVNQGLKRVFDRVREEEKKPQLSLLIWEDYLAPGVVERFEAGLGARVRVTEVENSEQLKQEIAENPESFDVVVADEQTLKELITLRLVRPFDKADVSQMVSGVDPAFASPVDPAFAHSVPYLWGLTVLAGRKELLEGTEPSWSLLWREDLRIGLLDEPSDMLWLALLGLGHDPANATPGQVEEAGKKLAERFPDFTGRMTDLFTGLDELEAGNLDLIVTYNGDAASRVAENPEIAVIVPKEGVPLWIDSFAVSREARQPALALEFIRFMGKAEIAAESSNYLRYASPTRDARKEIASELLDDPVLFPTEEMLSKCAFVRFPDTVERNVHQTLSRLVKESRASEVGANGATSEDPAGSLADSKVGEID